MSSLCCRLLLRQAFSESRHFSLAGISIPPIPWLIARSKNDGDADVDVDKERQQHPLQSMHLLHRNDVIDQNNKHFCGHGGIDISNPYDDEILFDVPNFDDILTFGSNISTDETSCYFDDSSYDCSNNDKQTK